MTTASATALKTALKAHGHALGLDLVGVCAAHPFARERERLLSRPVNPFEEPDADLRTDPERLLPGCRSIVAVAVSYLMPDPPPGEGDLHGWLSRYCRGEDYHTLIEERLQALATWLEAEVPGSRSYVHVDIGPPVDRAIAERAGLGRYGKSTLLIAPKLGTWTFIGELFTTVELPPDPEAAFNPCGSCTRCLDACPTGALTEWQLDWSRCLGYLNQADGPVPLEFRAPMKDRLFGCDDCQDVCPYNRTALSGLHPEFAPIPGIGDGPDLVELLAMTTSEFDRRYTPTAAHWRGLPTVQRNAVVALGNSGKPAALAPLQAALGHPDPLVRGHAAWGLGRLGQLCPEVTPAAQAALSAQQPLEQDPYVRQEITQALTL